MGKQMFITIKEDGKDTNFWYVKLGDGLTVNFQLPMVIEEAEYSHDDTELMYGFELKPIVSVQRSPQPNQTKGKL